MSLLEKLQNLPEKKKKIILRIMVILVGILLFTFYFKNLQEKLKILSGQEIKKQLKIEEFQGKLKELPKVEIPKIEVPEVSEKEWEKMKEGLREEEIKELEEMLKKIQE
jgi:preprotein translocase subunit SecF